MQRVDWSPPAMVLIAVASLNLVIASQVLYYSDFAMIHATSVALRAGNPAYVPFLVSDGLWRNLNPPQLDLFVWPLAYFSLSAAAAIFRVANLLALAAAIVLVVPLRELASRRGGWLIGAALATPALVMQCGAVQVAGLLALLAASTWRAVAAGRWTLAAVFIGSLCAIKPLFLPLFLWLAFTRRWRAVVIAAMSGAALATASVGWRGLQPQLDWLHATGLVTWFHSPYNVGWMVPVTQVLGPEPLSYRVIVAVSGLLGAGLAVFAATMAEDRRALLVLITGSIVAAPLGWLYYLCVAIPCLMRWTLDGGRWPVLTWLLWIPLPIMPRIDQASWLGPTVGSAYCWGTVALLIAVTKSGDTRSPADTSRRNPT